MPALSIKQRRLMAMAEHNPSAISDKNKSVLSMSKDDLHDFASTPEKGLPVSKDKKKRKPSGFAALKDRKPKAMQRDSDYC